MSKWDRSALYWKIAESKKLVADGGYSGEPEKILIQSTALPKEMNIWIGQVKARQETLHTRLKSYKILKHRFYHGNSTERRMELHKMAVQAICTITQYAYENGHPLFDLQMP